MNKIYHEGKNMALGTKTRQIKPNISVKPKARQKKIYHEKPE